MLPSVPQTKFHICNKYIQYNSYNSFLNILRNSMYSIMNKYKNCFCMFLGKCGEDGYTALGIMVILLYLLYTLIHSYMYCKSSFYTVPKVIVLPKYNTKCSGKYEINAEQFVQYLVFLYIPCYNQEFRFTFWTVQCTRIYEYFLVIFQNQTLYFMSYLILIFIFYILPDSDLYILYPT